MDGVVGQRLDVGGITVLVIAPSDATVSVILSVAERAAHAFKRVAAGEAYLVLEQVGVKAAYIPPEYHLGTVQAIVAQMVGGNLTTKVKGGAEPSTANSDSRVGQQEAAARGGCVKQMLPLLRL